MARSSSTRGTRLLFPRLLLPAPQQRSPPTTTPLALDRRAANLFDNDMPSTPGRLRHHHRDRARTCGKAVYVLATPGRGRCAAARTAASGRAGGGDAGEAETNAAGRGKLYEAAGVTARTSSSRTPTTVQPVHVFHIEGSASRHQAGRGAGPVQTDIPSRPNPVSPAAATSAAAAPASGCTPTACSRSRRAGPADEHPATSGCRAFMPSGATSSSGARLPTPDRRPP